MSCKGLLVALLAAGRLSSVVAQNAPPPIDPCQLAADQQFSNLGFNDPEFPDDQVFLVLIDAQTAFDCISSVPLDVDAALGMISYFRSYYAFHSTLDVLRDPPPSYQQPAIDIMARFDEIEANLVDQIYTTQYELEVDLQRIARDVHDTHFNLQGLVIGLFEWSLPDSIISVSSDGQELPQVYANSDVRKNIPDASPIVEIEGESVFDYLRTYIEEGDVIEHHDPHVEWNLLMDSHPVKFSRTGTSGTGFRSPSKFQITRIYQGPSISGLFANGTEFTWDYAAGSRSDLTNEQLFSGEAIFNSRVFNPASLQLQGRDAAVRKAEDAPAANISTRDPEPFVPYFSYPDDPIVLQASFAQGGTVSGYLLDDNSVGVLSMPHFGGTDNADSATFSAAVGDFIFQAKEANAQRVVIDLSGNPGGDTFLAFEIFRQFFPNTQPTSLFRTRANPEMRTMGTILMDMIQNGNTIVQAGGIDLAAVADFYNNIGLFNTLFTLREDGLPWDSYEQYFGPAESDEFGNATNNAQYDYNSPLIPEKELAGFDIFGFGQNPVPETYEQPWAPEDIILLTDGTCGSTCYIFFNLMKADAGVRSVVLGGIPEYGAMQAIGGTKGSNVRDWGFYDGLATDVRNIIDTFPDGGQAYLATLGLTPQDIDFLPPAVGRTPWRMGPDRSRVNTLDSVNPSSPNVPRQVAYEGANCRLFYTGEMARDITNAWRAAAQYGAGNETICVPGSVDGPGSQPNDTLVDDPGYSYESVWENVNSTSLPDTGSPGGGEEEGENEEGGNEEDDNQEGGNEEGGNEEGGNEEGGNEDGGNEGGEPEGGEQPEGGENNGEQPEGGDEGGNEGDEGTEEGSEESSEGPDSAAASYKAGMTGLMGLTLTIMLCF